MARHKFVDKRQWVLDYLRSKYEQSCRIHNPPMRPFVCTTDEDDQVAWKKRFGGKEVIYTIGPNISPDFTRTCRRMYEAGDLMRVTGGNQNAKFYGQKTYYIAYTLSEKHFKA